MSSHLTVALTRAIRGALALLACALTLTTLAAAPAVATSAPAAPAAATSAPAAPATPLALDDTTEPLGPGIILRHQQYLESTGWIDRHVVTVDLSEPAVTTDLVHADAVAQGSPLSTQVNAVRGVAGVNGDFFDIGQSGAALGFEIAGAALRKSGDRNDGQSIGVTKDGIGQLTNLALAAKATFGGTDHPLSGLNQVGVPAGAIGAYTPEWGAYDRATQVAGAANAAEVWVADGKVTRAAAAPAGGTLPAGTTALVGREAGADAVRTLAVGDPVALSYALSPALADQLRFAVGTDVALVRDGVKRPDEETSRGAAGTSIAPRTSVGFRDGGRTMILMTVDGPGGTGKGGVTLPKLAQMMADLGAETAVNLDGGGSTTMVARALGDPLAGVRNAPSDGQERLDPNGVGVVVTPGDGRVEDLVVTPGSPTARVFPGLHRRLTAKGVDDHQFPVPIDPGDVRWRARPGSVEDGLARAPEWAARQELDVRAATAGARTHTDVRVLGRLATLELSSRRLSFADTSTSTTLTVTGRDRQGFAAPIELEDLRLDYDRSVIRIEAAPDGLKVTPLAKGATVLTASVSGQTVKLPVTVGVDTAELYRFDHPDETARWTVNGTAGAAKSLSQVPEGLKLTYAKQRNMGITKVPAETRIPVPGQPLRIRVRMRASVATEFAALYWTDATGVTKNQLRPGVVPGENAIEFTLPGDTKFPVAITQLQVIETNAARQADGEVVFESIETDTAPAIDLPAAEPLRPDRLISPDGRTNGRDDWSFATLSDIQFTAANPELTKVGVAALERIRQAKPDLVVLNGDITDLGAAEDLTLARQTLEAGGCDLIKPGEEPAPESTPDASSGKVPCYYVPGNHESYRAGGQGDLAPFVAQFGRPYRTFDHKGTRFILLNSALGTLRTSDFDQLPLLEQALREAKSDSGVRNVMVFAHHPVDDPEETKASQLGDRREVALVERLLTAFREDSGKGAAMVGSHAQVVNVHRIEGVPYAVLPSSGKAPYGTPDRGGFTGYVRWSVDRDARASRQWLTADVNAFAQSIALDAPASLVVGRSAPLGGSIVQPSGVSPGTRVVPLAYPMSVHWSGDRRLAIGSGPGAKRIARRGGRVAILNPITRRLTALRPGSVTVRVTNPSMREFTDPASLDPITAERTITVACPARPSRRGGRPGCRRQPHGGHGSRTTTPARPRLEAARSGSRR